MPILVEIGPVVLKKQKANVNVYDDDINDRQRQILIRKALAFGSGEL